MRDVRQPFTVRVIYVLPNDAQPWEEVSQRATDCLEDLQWFFADEMDRLGYGPKTFEIAHDDSGALVFHQVRSTKDKNEFQEHRMNNCKRAAGNELRRAKDVVVYVYESYSITNGQVFDQGAKSKRSEAFISSLHLKMARREWIAHEKGYCGEVYDWISSEPMKGNTLSWNGRGKKLGDVSGSAFGVVAHELAHCFGLPHTADGDIRHRDGNLMGKGFRGMRGYFRPDLTEDRCFLSQRSAEILDKCDFFKLRTLKPKSLSFVRNQRT
jgi:hypothetical protein